MTSSRRDKSKTNPERWAIVTGASSGIGLEFCRRLGEEGYNLVMVSNQQKELVEAAGAMAERYGVQTEPIMLDLTRPDACEHLTDALDIRGLQPEVLINNAGIFSFNYLTETPIGKINAFIDLHMRAVTHLSVEFARRFAAQGKGEILNMSSLSCWMPMPGLAMYSSTKAYIRVLSRALHYELRGTGASLTVACPGGIATDLFGLPKNLQKLALRLGFLQTPEKFTRKAVRRMHKGKKQYINGLLNRFCVFFIGIMPTPVRLLPKRLMLDKGIKKP